MVSEKLVDKILDETDLEKEDLEEKIEKKMEEFEGLVSEEGALHLVAKDEGLQPENTEKEDLKIENIVPEMRNVTLKARVTNIMEPNTFERDEGDEGKVQNIVLGDDTGTIRVTLWDDQTEITDKVDEGDPIELEGAYTVEDDRENAELRLGDETTIKMADEDEVPEVETQDRSAEEASIGEVSSENSFYRVKGMIMNVYTSNPFYKTCPECGTSVQEEEEEEEYICPDHGEVKPDNALAISAVLDDGSDNMRCVFFREQARELLDIDKDEKLEKEEDIEEAAGNAVGKELEVEGRTRYNDYFGRLEIIVNEMGEIDIDQEIENLMEIMEV